MIVKPNPDSLIAAAGAVIKGKGPAPVHLWNPPYCGDLDIRIRRDGTWHYLGTPIGRPALVRLFANILKREGDHYFLVTPVEKVGIAVDDVPFMAVDFAFAGSGDGTPKGQTLTFTTNVGDSVAMGPDNPLRMARSDDGAPAPYVHIRRGLEARIDRKSFYRMVDLGQTAHHDGSDWFGIWSAGAFFPLILASELG